MKPEFVLKVVTIIFGILLCSYWIIYTEGLTKFRLMPNIVDDPPSSSVFLEFCESFEQRKNTMGHRNRSKLQPVPKDLKLFRLAMSESEMGVLLDLSVGMMILMLWPISTRKKQSRKLLDH